ncbi:MAG: DUF4834 family protein [Bacteroidota bacterium]
MHPILNEASITGLFRLLLIIFTVYAVFSIFTRFIFPLILRKVANDLQNRFTSNNNRSQQEQNRKKEGEISITYVNKDKNSGNQPVDAEYVDYEEIK